MKLIERPVRSIAGAIADSAARWGNPDFPPRVRALAAVVARTGYSEPVVEYAFDRLFGALTRDAIEATIAGELGSLDALDRFVDISADVRARALPVGRVCVLSSRTTIGVAIVPAIFALCAKCAVLVKDREDALVAAFFATLADEIPELRDTIVAQSWDGETQTPGLGDFDAVAAFGDDATLTRIRAQLAPASRWIPFGTKASCGYVARGALHRIESATEIADGAARDLSLYETQGCLSLHVLFVESGAPVTPSEFAGLLAASLERAAVEFPIGRREAGDVAAITRLRDAATFRSAQRKNGALRSDASATYLAVLDPPQEEPPFFLPRALAIHTVESPDDAARYLQRHRLPIEAVAVAGMRSDVAQLALRLGAARIAAFGTLQSPPLRGYHGGRPRIAEFVRWVVDET